MFLIKVGTGDKIEAFIERMTASDFKKIKREKNFQFKWDAYKKQEVYKLFIKENEILGLIHISDRQESEFNFVEIILLDEERSTWLY